MNVPVAASPSAGTPTATREAAASATSRQSRATSARGRPSRRSLTTQSAPSAWNVPSTCARPGCVAAASDRTRSRQRLTAALATLSSGTRVSVTGRSSCRSNAAYHLLLHTLLTVPPDDRDGLDRLARYLLRPPVSLDRLHVGGDAAFLAYAGRRRSTGRGTGDEATRDPLDFLARIVMHIPEPRRHVIRYYGAYSSVVRSRRARQAASAAGGGAAPALPPPEHEPVSLEWRAARRRCAQLVRRIYEVDPLVCPRCGGTMRIIAFMTEPRVVGRILRHFTATEVDARSPPGDDPSSRQRTVTAA